MSRHKGWVDSRLRFVASIRNSNVDKKSYDGQRPVFLCNYTDVYYNERITSSDGLMEATASQSEIDKFCLLAGDVIITKDSETADDIGIPAWVPQDLPGVVCGYHLTQIRPSAAVVPEFVFRTMQATSTRQYLEVETPGVTRFGLDQDTIRSIPIFIPSIVEQDAIVNFLNGATTRIDALVVKKRRFIELLREKRQALITRAVTKGLDGTVRMKKSGVDWLGDVPAHWDVVPPAVLFTDSKERAQEGDQMLSATQKYGVIPLAEFEALEQRQVTKASTNFELRKHVEVGDFVISMRSMDGGLERSYAAGSVRSSYSVLKSQGGVYGPYFGLLLKCSLFIQALRLTSNFIRDGQDLSFAHVKKVKLPLPDLGEQQRIADFVGRSTARIDKLITLTERSIALLEEHRAALITDAVTGKIDLSNAA